MEVAAAAAAADQSMKPHVGILPSPGMGHFIPLFEFAKRLVHHRGLRVTFLVITTDSSPAQDALFSSPTIPPDLHVLHLPPAPPSALTDEDTPVVTRLSVIVRESLRPLKSVLHSLSPLKALVIDLFTTDAFDVCRELSIPTYTFFTASSALLAQSLYLPTLDREIPGEFVDLPGPIQAPGCNPIRTEDLLDQIRNKKIDEYKWYLLHMSRLPMASGIIANTWQALEPVTLQALEQNPFFQNLPTPKIFPVGPIIKEAELAETESDRSILNWLDKQPPESVLLVVFGSGGTLSTAQLTELAFGLEMSEQRFVLVAREPSDAATFAAFFNVGSKGENPAAYLPEGFEERTAGMGVVASSWVSQVAVLRHGSTGGFLSHCGWNSTLESVAHGVPIIAWPLYAEQRMNATILEEEVGVAVKARARHGEKVIGREEVERVVRLVMEGEEGKAMRRKARELMESGRKALERGGVSYASLTHLVNIWKS